MAQTRPTSAQGKLAALLKQDPKKATVLAVLLAVLAVMLAKTLLGGGSPKSASAMPVATPAQSPAVDTNNTIRNADASGLLRNWIAQPLPQAVSRNIFEVKLDYFPMEAGRAHADSRTIDDPTFWERLAKSIDAQAEEQHKRENLIQNLRQQAGQLQLTSTVMGPRPKAMINGAMVGEGEVVAKFRVLKIEARTVTIEREGIKLVVPMK